MTARWIRPDALFDGVTLREGLALAVDDGRVAEVGPPPPDAELVAGVIGPGFLDLQVNGGGGVLFNRDPTPEGIAAIAAAHRRFGTVGLLPTVITDAPEVLDRAAEAALRSRALPGMLGLHVEGPHIALARRGTHDARFVRPLDERTMAVVARLRAEGLAVLITLAPEATEPGQIRALAGMGAVVSIGHSDATAEAVRAAIAEGARSFTHLFNAMSPLLHRAPGVVGAALNSDLHAGIICDGIHVADELVALAVRARPVARRMILVSDAMPTVGGPDHFDLYGQRIRLVEGRLINAEGGLAGAHVTQAEGVQRLIARCGVAPDLAWAMASAIPAELIGQPARGGLVGQRVADLIVLDRDWAFRGALSE